MPASWVDDFTHDYFADSTYSLIAGVEGTGPSDTFEVSGGALRIHGDGFTTLAVAWDDPRSPGLLSCSLSLTVSDFHTDAGLGIAQVELGLIDQSDPLRGAAGLWLAGSSTDASAFGKSDADIESSPAASVVLTSPFTVSVDITPTGVTNNTGQSVTFSPTLAAELAAPGANYLPFAAVFGVDPAATTLVTRWSYGFAPLAAPPGLIIAGEHNIGLVRHKRPVVGIVR